MRFDDKRRRMLAFIGAALSVPAVATTSQPFDASIGQDRFLDLMPDFWAVYDGHVGEDLSVRSGRLLDGFFRKHGDVYRLAGVKVRPRDVATWLPGFDIRA